MKVGVLIYTYNRTDDAKILMEIVRNVWGKNSFLKEVIIVHAYNGKDEWWPEPYMEDALVRLPNPGHFLGAEALLNGGMKYFSETYPDVDYVVVLAADTWPLNPAYVENIIKSMHANGQYVATCPWGTVEKDNMWKIGMAIDFAIFDRKWVMEQEIFPIRYAEFVEKYYEVFAYSDETIYPERVLALRFKQAALRSGLAPSEQYVKRAIERHIYRMRDREPVHDERGFLGVIKGRKMYWPNIGLVTHHEPEPKQKILKKLNGSIGPNAQRLIEAKDLEYYNHGARKMVIDKNGKKIVVGD